MSDTIAPSYGMRRKLKAKAERRPTSEAPLTRVPSLFGWQFVAVGLAGALATGLFAARKWSAGGKNLP
jgi:hypothetical protein